MRVVFTDLDGSLLDADSSSFGAARPALDALERRGIPVILVSSRTRAELEDLRQTLELDHPFICEDGAAVFVPFDYFPDSILDDSWSRREGYAYREMGFPYAHLRRVLKDVRAELQADIVGFGDWTEGELASTLGVPLEVAHLARQREYSEIFAYAGDRLRLENAVHRHHLQLKPLQLPYPESSWYLTGDVDEGTAVQVLLDCYRAHAGLVRSLGLGDTLSDAAFLSRTDNSVVLPGPQADALWEKRQSSWQMASLPGPAGWNDAVLDWLAASNNHAEA
ncbi:MAG: HAD hydrolase family protein [Cyanobacteria bacterium P01_D01_bin.123]